MLEINVSDRIKSALLKFRDRLESVLIESAGTAAQIVIGTSVADFMRDAKGEPRRRRPDDSGPLRIVSGRLVRSLVGARTGTQEPESIYRIATDQGHVIVTFGSSVTYARIHEFGGVAGGGAVIPGRPYLGPAIAQESGEVANVFDQNLTELAREVGL